MRYFVLFFLAICPAMAAVPLPNLDTTQQKTGVHNTTDAAVVIGIEDYFSLPDVPGAAADAQLVRDTLVYTVGLDPARVSLLVRAEGQGRASRSGIQKAIEEKAAQVKSGGRLWIYFAGHGSASASSSERILLSDQTEANPASFEADSITVSEIQSWGVVGGGQVVLITDACFNGTGRDGSIQTGTRYAVPVTEIQKVKLTQWHATAAEQVAQPLAGTGHGAFTYFWVGAIRGWADGQFGARDGQITAQEAQEYVSKALSTMQIRGETPQYTGIGDWVVSKGKEIAPNLSELAKVVPAVLPTPTETPAVVRVPAKTERISTAIDVRVGEVCFKGPKGKEECISATGHEKSQAWLEPVARLEALGCAQEAEIVEEKIRKWKALRVAGNIVFIDVIISVPLWCLAGQAAREAEMAYAACIAHLKK